MDEIRIEGLKLYAYHGVYNEEKRDGQEFIVNTVLYTNTRAAGRKDDLSLSTRYDEVCNTIKHVMTRESYDLIETAAEGIAEAILIGYPHVKAVDVEVCKPNAPMPTVFDNVSVKIHRAWHDVFISYGSNLGDSEGYIEDAMQALENHEMIEVVNDSTRIVTKPVGPVKQDDFLNGVCNIRTLMEPEELLQYLHILEQHANRVRDIHWGPRTLDLDILMYDNLVYESEDLIIPHIEMHKRAFVLEPMCEIAPNRRHPVIGKTMTELLSEVEKLDTDGIIK